MKRFAFRGGAIALAACCGVAFGDDVVRPSPEASAMFRAAKQALEQDPTMEYLPGIALVKFAEGVTPAERERTLAMVSGHLIRTFEIVPGLAHISVDIPVEQAVAVLSTLPGVEYAEYDFVYRASVNPNDPSFGSLWGLHNTGQNIQGINGTSDADIDAPAAWDTFTGNQDFVVAVIDTGTLYTHPDLDANIWTNPGETAGNGIDDDGNGYVDDIRGWDFYSDDANPTDSEGHGTHTAGTIGAEGNNGVGITGVNWRCRIMPLRFLGPGGGTTSDAVLAVQYCTAKGVKVSNNSWGGGGYSASLINAINASQSVGHIFVCAAGNSGVNIDSSPQYPAAYNSSNIISVAATTNRDGLASFSNYGATNCDMGAPGVDVLSTVTGNGYSYYDGTSMASPHVAGVVAMVYAQNPTWTWSTVKNRVMTTTRPISALSGRCQTGGVVNLQAALQPVVNTPPTVVITSPANGATFTFGADITFTNSSTDTEDGNLSSTCVWSSSLNGALGSGTSITRNTLVPGTHTITASVTDSGTLTTVATINITVGGSGGGGTAPSAPLVGTTKNLGGGQARIRWTDTSNNEDKFQIERQQQVGTVWTNTTIIDNVPANTGEYIDAPGAGKFRYRVRAVNTIGNSAWTARRTVTVTN